MDNIGFDEIYFGFYVYIFKDTKKCYEQCVSIADAGYNNNNNNNNLLHLGFYPVAVVILHVYKI